MRLGIGGWGCGTVRYAYMYVMAGWLVGMDGYLRTRLCVQSYVGFGVSGSVMDSKGIKKDIWTVSLADEGRHIE